MGQNGDGSFDSLLSIVGSDNSDGSWFNALKKFCSINADALSLPTEGKNAFLNLLLQKVSEVTSDHLESDPELKEKLCDCVRISVRDKSDTDALASEIFLTGILSIAEHPQSNVSEMAVRCLINLMNENIKVSNLFLNETVNGLNRVLEFLKLKAQENKSPMIMHLTTKLLYMLLSQRYQTVGFLLRTMEAEAIFLPQFGLCLSASHYNDLSIKLRILPSPVDIANVVSDSDVNLELNDGSSTRGLENIETASSSSAAAAAAAETIPNCITETPPQEKAEVSVGLVRNGWGNLFVETSKLLYALHGVEGNGVSDVFSASTKFALVYDLLSDVILMPSDISNVPSGFADLNTQSLCRRHALQLAMLSLDLDAKTQASSSSPISSSVPLILQKLLVRGGVKVLCGVLDNYFAEAEKGAETYGTTSNFGVSNSSLVASLSPILVLLIRIATSSSSGNAELKAIIFPNPWSREGEEDVEEVGSDYLNQNMDPTDIPKGTLRAHLIGLMTSLDSVLKRYCAELLYALCDSGTGEFVTRTGFGNAIALMQIKGLI